MPDEDSLHCSLLPAFTELYRDREARQPWDPGTQEDQATASGKHQEWTLHFQGQAGKVVPEGERLACPVTARTEAQARHRAGPSWFSV